MAEPRKWWLITYDVRDPKRWRRVYALLRGTGQRIQYSVFRARLSDRELQRLRWELERRLDTADALLVIPLCTACASKVVVRDKTAAPWDTELPRWQIV